MKKIIGTIASIIVLIAAFSLGYFSGNSTVHAQISSPAYTCNTVGQASAYPCAQYLVAVAPVRLGGGIFVYQIQDQQVDVRTINAPLVANGTVNSGVSIQAFQPNSTINTVTISAGAP